MRKLCEKFRRAHQGWELWPRGWQCEIVDGRRRGKGTRVCSGERQKACRGRDWSRQFLHTCQSCVMTVRKYSIVMELEFPTRNVRLGANGEPVCKFWPLKPGERLVYQGRELGLTARFPRVCFLAFASAFL